MRHYNEKTDKEREKIKEMIEILLESHKSFKGQHFDNIDSELSYWLKKLND